MKYKENFNSIFVYLSIFLNFIIGGIIVSYGFIYFLVVGIFFVLFFLNNLLSSLQIDKEKIIIKKNFKKQELLINEIKSIIVKKVSVGDPPTFENYIYIKKYDNITKEERDINISKFINRELYEIITSMFNIEFDKNRFYKTFVFYIIIKNISLLFINIIFIFIAIRHFSQ